MNKTSDLLTNYLRDIYFNKPGTTLDLNELDEDFKTFGEMLVYFTQCMSESQNFAKAISVGDFNRSYPSRNNELASPLKSLHASLKHLTWQSQQVAKGDYTQRIDFMGDLADAFNTMIVQLDGRQQELINFNNNLQKMVDERSRTVIELKDALLKTMAELVDCRCDITGGHIERTQSYLRVLLDAIIEEELYTDEIRSWDRDILLQSAQLHDIGKLSIEDSILKKPGKLTTEEFAKIKEHTTFGASVINKIKNNTTDQAFLEYALTFALTHHERWDGSGYPSGLKGEDIPLLGRIMAVADVYDALVSKRPYKSKFTHEEAMEIIHDSSGSHFDPTLAELAIKYSDELRIVRDQFELGTT